MKKYICRRCGYASSRLQNLRRHFNRKKKCTLVSKEIDNYSFPSLNKSDTHARLLILSTKCQQNVNNNQNIVNSNVNTRVDKKTQKCKFCEKPFNTRQSKSRHEKKYCKKKEKNEEKYKQIENNNIILQDKLEDIIIKFTNIQVEHDLLKQELNTMKRTTSNNIISNNGIIGNSNNIIVNNFGSENIDYLTDKVYKRLIKLPLSGVAKLIGHIHFNPNHPENHNVRITNKKLKFAEIKKDNKWLLQHKKIVLDDLLESGMIRFDDFKDSNEDEAEKVIMKRYKKMVELYELEKDKITNQIELEVLNGSNKITDDIEI